MSSQLCILIPSLGFVVRRARGARALKLQGNPGTTIGAYVAQDVERPNVEEIP